MAEGGEGTFWFWGCDHDMGFGGMWQSTLGMLFGCGRVRLYIMARGYPSDWAGRGLICLDDIVSSFPNVPVVSSCWALVSV